MKAQNLNKHVIQSDESRQDFLDVTMEVYLKFHKALNDLKDKGIDVSKHKEVFEYALRVGQYMTLVEINTGLTLDAKEEGEADGNVMKALNDVQKESKTVEKQEVKKPCEEDKNK